MCVIRNKEIEVGEAQARQIGRLKQQRNFSHFQNAEFYFSNIFSEVSLKMFEALIFIAI